MTRQLLVRVDVLLIDERGFFLSFVKRLRRTNESMVLQKGTLIPKNGVDTGSSIDSPSLSSSEETTPTIESSNDNF